VKADVAARALAAALEVAVVERGRRSRARSHRRETRDRGVRLKRSGNQNLITIVPKVTSSRNPCHYFPHMFFGSSVDVQITYSPNMDI
jgi:hypothetical protein